MRFSAELYLEMAAIWSYPAVDRIKWEILEGKDNAKNIIFYHNNLTSHDCNLLDLEND